MRSQSQQQNVEEIKRDPSAAAVGGESYEFENGIAVDSRQPQQNTFNLPGGIVVSSAFDSGNLGKCYPAEDGSSDTFTCYMSGDALPYASKGHYHTWFYFSVKGV